jgi:hypothetical protein
MLMKFKVLLYCTYIIFRIPSELVPVHKLPQYETPATLRRVINHGFKPFENMSPADTQKLKEVR